MPDRSGERQGLLTGALNGAREFTGRIRRNSAILTTCGFIVAAIGGAIGDGFFSAGKYFQDGDPARLLTHVASDLAILSAAGNITPDADAYGRTLRNTLAVLEAGAGIYATQAVHLGGPDQVLPALAIAAGSLFIGGWQFATFNNFSSASSRKIDK